MPILVMRRDRRPVKGRVRIDLSVFLREPQRQFEMPGQRHRMSRQDFGSLEDPLKLKPGILVPDRQPRMAARVDGRNRPRFPIEILLQPEARGGTRDHDEARHQARDGCILHAEALGVRARRLVVLKTPVQTLGVPRFAGCQDGLEKPQSGRDRRVRITEFHSNHVPETRMHMPTVS